MANDIQNSISYYQRLIGRNEDDIVQLYRDVARLEEMASYISDKAKEFEMSQESYILATDRINHLGINSNITSRYCEGAIRTFTGASFQNARDGLDNSLHSINEKIEELQDKIQQKRMQISNWQYVIGNLQHELYYSQK